MISLSDITRLLDRKSIEEWEQDGAPTILDRAKAHTQKVLAEHHPQHIAPELDDKIRAAFDIRLPKEAVGRG